MALENRLLSWINSITETLELNLIHVDGLTSFASYEREGKLKALLCVSGGNPQGGLGALSALRIKFATGRT